MVRVDLSETKFHTGLYTENCFVLAEGWYDDNVFHVLALGFPPAETSDTTRSGLYYFCVLLISSSCNSYFTFSRSSWLCNGSPDPHEFLRLILQLLFLFHH